MLLFHTVEPERKVAEGSIAALADVSDDVQDFLLGICHRPVLCPGNSSTQSGECQAPAPEVNRSEADGRGGRGGRELRRNSHRLILRVRRCGSG